MQSAATLTGLFASCPAEAVTTSVVATSVAVIVDVAVEVVVPTKNTLELKSIGYDEDDSAACLAAIFPGRASLALPGTTLAFTNVARKIKVGTIAFGNSIKERLYRQIKRVGTR